MTKKRIFRCCISFLVICCVLFNIAAIPARAEVVTITSGIIALLFSIGMGIVAIDITMDLVNGVERSMYDSAIDYYEAEAEKRQEFIDWFDNLKTDVKDGIIETTAAVRDAIRHWGAGLMTGDGFEVESEPEKGCLSCLHSLYTFPAIPAVDLDVYPYAFLRPDSIDETYDLVFSKSPYTFSSNLLHGPSDEPIVYYYINFSEYGSATSWRSGSMPPGTVGLGDSYPVTWANYDILDHFTGEVYLAGCSSADSTVSTVTPSVFVGDIPGKIQSGEADEDQIYVPERLDVTQILTGEVDDLEAVNDISTQLAEGTLTYEQYLEMTQAKDDVNTDVGTDVWDPPDDPGTFALDLTQYFPFCIPFDLYAFFSCLNADPVTPVIHWELAVPGGTSLPIDLDLSPFDGVARLLRTLQLLLFCVGLAFKTRDLIKG